MVAIEDVRCDGFPSFPAGSPGLRPLNVLRGPNAAGKSNFIEAFDLLALTPPDFATAFRAGVGVERCGLGKGPDSSDRASSEAVLDAGTPTGRPLRCSLEFGAVWPQVEVFDEVVEDAAAARDDGRVSLIVTTHSEGLLDQLTNDCEAVVFFEWPSGATALKRLDCDELASWLDDRRLGDRAKGVLGANP